MNPRVIQHFWTNVFIPHDDDECWEWKGTKWNGYGKIANAGETPLYAHRVSYELHFEPVPGGLEIDHLCGNRSCVNPLHLDAVTHAENKERQKKLHLHS